MVKRFALLCLVLVCGLAGVAESQMTGAINGKISRARPVVFGEKSAILLHLQGRPETYVVQTADAVKFGLLKPETAAGGPDEDKMAKDLEAVIGWRVRLTIEFKGSGNAQECRVKNLKRLPGK